MFHQSAKRKQWIAGALVTGMLMLPGLWWTAASAATPANDSSTVQIKTGIALGAKGDQIIPSISLRDADIKDILYSLSEQGGFNLLVDDGVTGTLSLDLKNTSINKILEYVMTLADLTYYKDGGTMIITSKKTGDDKSLNKLVLKSIPVKYSNAQDLSDVLNNTVFSVSRPGGNKKAVATADPRTNSILVMGNELDIDLANRALQQLDFPLQHKTFFLKNAKPEDVANTISQTLFSIGLKSAGGGRWRHRNYRHHRRYWWYRRYRWYSSCYRRYWWYRRHWWCSSRCYRRYWWCRRHWWWYSRCYWRW